MRRISILLVFVSFPMFIFAQWECRSKMASTLKPLGNSDLLWSAEFISSAGKLYNNDIYNADLFMGLDYTKKSHSIYFEGGFKYWRRYDKNIYSDSITKAKFSRKLFGFRELFYSYTNSSLGKISLGLQTSKFDDHYLLNERVLGLNYELRKKQFDIRLISGTVSNDFARNGTFCSVKYLYDVIKNRQMPIIGNALGETNLAGATFSWHPSKGTKGSEKDEVKKAEPDEFSASSEFEVKNSKLINIETVGATMYSEFGSKFPYPLYLIGAFASIELFNQVAFKPEILYQSANTNRGFIYLASLEKTFTIKENHRLLLKTGYTGFYSDNANNYAANSFSNLFVGEVLRMDLPDLDLFEVSAKYTHTKSKSHVKLQFVSQVNAREGISAMSEFDAEIGKTFFSVLQINAIFSRINAANLYVEDKPTANMARVELRYNF